MPDFRFGDVLRMKHLSGLWPAIGEADARVMYVNDRKAVVIRPAVGIGGAAHLVLSDAGKMANIDESSSWRFSGKAWELAND